MKRQEFVHQLDVAAEAAGRLPVTASLLKNLSDILKKGEPPWWPKVHEAWRKRRFAPRDYPWALFLSCMHYEVLSDANSPLVPYFPSCGGAPEPVPPQALAQFFADLPNSFFERLENGQTRLYEELLSPLWVASAALFFQRRGLPFYLVEVDAGAGLNLAADVTVVNKDFASDLVSARIGLDSPPLDAGNINQRRWLTAVFMPDQMALIAEHDRAVETVLARRREEPDFIQLFDCPSELAVPFVAENIPADEDVGLLFLNVAATGRMRDAEYNSFKTAAGGMLRRWKDRALWVEVEPVRGPLFPSVYQLRLHRYAGGNVKQHVMAGLDLADREIKYDLEDSGKFLA